jgi:hypothetical protein
LERTLTVWHRRSIFQTRIALSVRVCKTSFTNLTYVGRPLSNWRKQQRVWWFEFSSVIVGFHSLAHLLTLINPITRSLALTHSNVFWIWNLVRANVHRI